MCINMVYQIFPHLSICLHLSKECIPVNNSFPKSITSTYELSSSQYQVNMIMKLNKHSLSLIKPHSKQSIQATYLKSMPQNQTPSQDNFIPLNVSRVCIIQLSGQYIERLLTISLQCITSPLTIYQTRGTNLKDFNWL